MGKYSWSDKQAQRREERRPKPQARVPLPKKSAKRMKEDKVYFAERDLFLLQRKKCELKTPDCTGRATCVHHSAGRIGDKYLNKTYWMASCQPCNSWVEVNDKEARARGLKLSKFST